MSNRETTFHISPQSLALLPGLETVASGFPGRIGAEGTPVVFEPSFSANGFRIAGGADAARIEYRRPCDAFRALGCLLAGFCPEGGAFEQRCAFDSLGVMLDVSRNAVLRPESLESLLRSFALMGINSVQLYMEDVYALPDEPFFGYGRGAYTPDELRRIDDYGNALGIEVIPCIQTLGHLEQILQWPAYSEIADVRGVLLAEDEQTYRLIGKMLDTVSSCFRTRSVHIGMDEAHGVGQGRYRKLHGEKRPFDVLNIHLKKVTEMCVSRGLKPMMWSDMYFRLGSATNDYYDKDSRIPEEIIGEISKEVEMVYWDYYHEDASFYEEWIDRHRSLGKEPLFASGAWSWGRLWTCLDHAFRTNAAGMKAARKKNLRNAFITVWGDDGAEVHPFSILPAIQYFAELAYTAEPDMACLEKLFSVACGSTFAGCVLAAEIDTIPSIKGCPTSYANFGKWILWHDPVFSFLDCQIPEELPLHYRSLAASLELLEENDPSKALQFPALLARTLAGKAQLHLEVKKCYRQGNVEGMRRLLSEVLAPTIQHFSDLWKRHKAAWHEWHKPFGWEVIEGRYAGTAARLESLGEIMGRWIGDPAARVPEFEGETARVRPENAYPEMYFTYKRSVTASAGFQ